LACLPLALLLLAGLGCSKGSGGDTLYAWDSTSSKVLVWKKLDELWDPAQSGATDTTIPDADRTIAFPGLVSSPSDYNLAWGGMALDTSTDMLYLVSDGGVVTRISGASNKNGSFSATTDVLQFTLDSDWTGSVFDQASVYPGANSLYVMENQSDGSGARVWAIPAAGTITSGASLAAASYTYAVTNDKLGSGLAAGVSGYVYALFGGGTALTDPATNTNLTTPRLRRGSSATSGLFPFDSSDLNTGYNVLFGASTDLLSPVTYGTLAFDGSKSALYVFAEPSAAFVSTATATIEVFNQSLFNNVGNYSPSRTLDSVPANLRILAHPADADWLVGAPYTPDSLTAAGLLGTGSTSLFIWKTPSDGGTPTTVTLPGTTEIRGLAVGND
jgi:hypothetical protein